MTEVSTHSAWIAVPPRLAPKTGARTWGYPRELEKTPKPGPPAITVECSKKLSQLAGFRKVAPSNLPGPGSCTKATMRRFFGSVPGLSFN